MKRIFYFLCAIALMCTGCEKDEYDITTITKTEVTAHTSMADFIIYVSDQNGNHSAATVEEIGVFLSTSANPTTKDKRVSMAIDEDYRNTIYQEYGAYVISVNGLAANTKYYVLPYISNRYSMITGEVVSFTTNGSATVTTKEATNITSSSAQLNGNISSDGGSVTISKRGFLLSLSSNPKIGDSNIDNWAEGGKTGNYGVIYSGLSDNTKYYFRAYAIVNNETVYGTTKSFTTTFTENKITMSLNDVTDITYNSAKVSGTITIGSSMVGQMSECGFICSSDKNPTFNSSWYWYWLFDSSYNSDFSTWSGQKNLSGKFQTLSQYTTYYYRMYYKIGSQYYYDETVKSFTTLRDPNDPRNDILGTYTMNAMTGNFVNYETGQSVTWYGIRISPYAPFGTNGVKVEGLYQGDENYVAFGTYDNTTKRLTLKKTKDETVPTFTYYYSSSSGSRYYADTYAKFQPIEWAYCEDCGVWSGSTIPYDNVEAGDFILTSSGRLEQGKSAVVSSATWYFIFDLYTPEKGNSILTYTTYTHDVVLTRTSTNY